MMLPIVGVIFFASIVIGMPVAFGMGLATSTFIIFFQGLDPTLLARRFYFSLGSFPLLAIPLFTMLGILADRAHMLPRLVVWLQMVLGRSRGGMAYLNVLQSLVFAGAGGTAVSDIASTGRVQIQLMVRAGYPVLYSAALTAATAVIGPIIPPSLAMIIYGMAVGNVSVGGLFVAAIIPGLLFTAGFLVMTWYTTRRHNYGVVLNPAPFREIVWSTMLVLPLLVLPFIIIGGIILGVFTVTESAGIGVVYTLIIGLVSKPRLRWKDIYDTVLYSAIVSSVVGMLLATGAIIAWLFAFNGVTQTVADFLTSVTDSPTIFLLLVMLALLVLGMVMDAAPIMVAVAPLLAPIAQQYGVPDFQFGIVFIVACMVGIVHPPVGIVLFMTSSIANVSVEKLSVAILPFVAWLILVVVLMIFIPELTTWLPTVFGF